MRLALCCCALMEVTAIAAQRRDNSQADSFTDFADKLAGQLFEETGETR